MQYEEYRDAVREELRQARRGLTWAELKLRLGLPYKVPCPEWTRRLQEEIGLTRISGPGRAHIWQVPSTGAKAGPDPSVAPGRSLRQVAVLRSIEMVREVKAPSMVDGLLALDQRAYSCPS